MTIIDFTKLIEKRMNNIIPVYDVNQLFETIKNYDEISKNKNAGKSSNNNIFNRKLENIVNNLMEK